jgi:hypothetical protein
MSNIVPNKETLEFPEKIEDNKNIKATLKPDTNNHDLGRIILPSENLAIAQKITDIESPKTKSNPLETSIGILEKGKQKRGKDTMVRNNDQNESLSNMFELISFL